MRASVRQTYGGEAGGGFPGNQGFTDLDLRRDQRLTGGPSEPGYYSKQEHTYNEGDTTKRVVEEVTKEKVGGTTVTRVVKHETTNRQTPMQHTIQFGQPYSSGYDDGSPRFQGSSGSSTGPLKVQWDPPGGGADGWSNGGPGADGVKVQTFNRRTNAWEASNEPGAGRKSQQGSSTYDFPAMIDDLERCTTWDAGIKPGNPGSTGSSSWAVPAGGSTTDWTNGTQQQVEVQPGGRIQIQFQPGSTRFAAEPKYEIQRFVQEPNQPLRRQTSDTYQSEGQYGGGQGQQYGPGPGGSRPQGQQYPYLGAGVEMPVIQVESSNDDRPHVEFSIQPNVRNQSAGGGPGERYQTSQVGRLSNQQNANRNSSQDDPPYQMDVYETTQTRRIVTEQDHPVVVRQTTATAFNVNQDPPWASPATGNDDSRSWGSPGASRAPIVVRNETGSLTRSLSSGTPQQPQRGGAVVGQSRPVTTRQSSQSGTGYGNQDSNAQQFTPYDGYKGHVVQTAASTSDDTNYPGRQTGYRATASEAEQDNSNYPRVYPVATPAKLPWETSEGEGYRQSSPRATEAASPRGGFGSASGLGSAGVRNQSAQHPLHGYQPDGGASQRVTSPQAYKSTASPLQQAAYEPPNAQVASPQSYGGAPMSRQGAYQAGPAGQAYQGGSPSYQDMHDGNQGAASPRAYQQGYPPSASEQRQNAWQTGRPGFQQGPQWQDDGGQQLGYYGGDNDSNSYGAPQSGYGTSQGHASPQSGYGPQQSGYGSSQSGYGGPQSGYGSPQSGYGPQPGGYSGYGPPSGEYGDQSQSGYGSMGGPAPPPPPPMAPPPPVEPTKNYYGPAVVPERAKVAKTVANSVLAPENRNSRGQDMFLRRQANAENWTVGGGGGGGAAEEQDYGGRISSGSTQSSSWGASPSPQRSTSQFGPPSPSNSQQGGGPLQRSNPPSPRPGIASLANETAHDTGKGGALFAKRQQRAERWAAADGQGQNPPGRPQVVGSANAQYQQQPQQQQQQPGMNRPMKLNVISRGPPAAGGQRGFTDL